RGYERGGDGQRPAGGSAGYRRGHGFFPPGAGRAPRSGPGGHRRAGQGAVGGSRRPHRGPVRGVAGVIDVGEGGRAVLVMATRNAKKRRELAALLEGTGLAVCGPEDCPGAPEEVEETGNTFRENALLKARAIAQACGVWAIADDSGLEVDALQA